jgi:hypothetical protein
MAGEWEVKLDNVGLYDEATHVRLYARRWTAELEGVEVETTVIIPGRSEGRTVAEIDELVRSKTREALRSLLEAL